jgi:hypothetical protein
MASLTDPMAESTPTETTTTTSILHVPSPECPSVDDLFTQLEHLGGLSWSKRNINKVHIAKGKHIINHLSQDTNGNTFTGVYLKGPHYTGLTITGDTGIKHFFISNSFFLFFPSRLRLTFPL